MKDLPYFKFTISDWIGGDITLCSYEAQGLFINICAFYWNREAKVPYDKLRRKFKDAPDCLFNELEDEGIYKFDSKNNIVVEFLDEQISERKSQSITNSINGSKGGRPRKEKQKTEKKPTAFKKETEPKAKKSNKEEKREEEKRKEDIIKVSTTDQFFTNDGLNNSFLEWIDYKKEKRQTLKPRTAEKQIKFLMRFDPETAIKIIDQSIMNGWTGLFELKNQSNVTGQTAKQRSDESYRNTLEEVKDAKRTDDDYTL